MNFETYKTESLVRIANDPQFKEHHVRIDAILRKRTGHLSVKRGIEVLSAVAREKKTINYKLFFEECVGGDVKWSRAKMGQVSKFLGDIQRYCIDHQLPILSALVVNSQTGECGEGFFKDMCALGLAKLTDAPRSTAQQERERCWGWGQSG